MAESTIYQFTESGLTAVTWCQPGAERVVVADSWRVVEGLAVGVTRHLDRFRQSVAHHAPEAVTTLEDFLVAALHIIPPSGEWFPRIECVATPHGHVFRFFHRAAPDRLTSAVLATAPHDPRTQPLVKGPDLDALMALRKDVSPTGATEAVIVTEDGFIAEGAYSSIVVWPPGEKEMWVVDDDIPRIPSVTEHILIEIARDRGVAVHKKKMLPESFENHAVWVVSALHGIREATSWVGQAHLSHSTGLRQLWQELLLQRVAPIHRLVHGDKDSEHPASSNPFGH